MTVEALPAITDEEIAWASELMGLGPDGFAAVDGDDSRLAAIRNLQTCDFEACPGSGKTTLLVAKLAILSARWPHRQRGICVLSHTNAARDEIDHRLSVNAASASLVRYPHFIGTIHGFVNEYLAIPWLRSKGNPIRLIDTTIALRMRRAKLARNWRYSMEQRNLDDYALQYDSADYSGKGKGNLSRNTPLCRAMEAATREGSEEGYFCFDEMFVWANELLDRHPEVSANLRARFPFVFVDEAQDNSELQSAMLHRIFMHGNGPSIRQRFGDSNQAIYAHANVDGAQTDCFPSGTVHNLPRSYRFSQGIAETARGFGVVPQALVGAGPARARVQCAAQAPVLFLFDDASVQDVLPCYGQHLVDTFSADDLAAGRFTAIAGVHDMDDSRIERVPRAMGHYAPYYDASIAKKVSVPATFFDHIYKAAHEARRSGDAHGLVNAVASALMRASELAGAAPFGEFQPRQSSHRNLLDKLSAVCGESTYKELLETVLAVQGVFQADSWLQALPQIASITSQLAGANALTKEVNDFLSFPNAAPEHSEMLEAAPSSQNCYSHPPNDAKVHIQLGSIHSVKGETHTATLVLDSFYFDHHLKLLKPWLLGDRTGGMKLKARGKPELESARLLGRLKLHYVAMTRPSHLLCLAMRKDTFDADELARLRGRGWKTIDCCL